MADLSPEKFFSLFKKAKESETVAACLRAIKEFKDYPNKDKYLPAVIHYLETEQDDQARAWATNLLEHIGGKASYNYLMSLLKKKETKEMKRHFAYTRFFALRALNAIAVAPTQKNQVLELAEVILADKADDYFIKSGAACLLAQQGNREALGWMQEMLEKLDDYWAVIRAARAISEYPLPELADALITILRTKHAYIDHKWQVIRALGSYKDTPETLQELIRVAREDPNSFIRQAAVVSLDKVCSPAARDVLLWAMQDENAEVRYLAANAMAKILPPDKACLGVVQAALDPELGTNRRTRLVDGLRLIDPGRSIPTEILNRELGSDDRQRAELAEKLMIDLGGWGAVQKLSQRSTTLLRLDGLLSESEKVVRDTFEGTIRQARFNFFFAMGVNIIIVVTGIALMGLAVGQLIQKPENLATWILPGATGVIGILVNMLFNNPRHNARNDLTALLNVTVIFLGYLRQLNQIDATFKHAYLENPDFSTDEMEKTVTQINLSVQQTLIMASQHLETRREAEQDRRVAQAAAVQPSP